MSVSTLDRSDAPRPQAFVLPPQPTLWATLPQSRRLSAVPGGSVRPVVPSAFFTNICAKHRINCEVGSRCPLGDSAGFGGFSGNFAGLKARLGHSVSGFTGSDAERVGSVSSFTSSVSESPCSDVERARSALELTCSGSERAGSESSFTHSDAEPSGSGSGAARSDSEPARPGS
jgi:hypothetical protein